jgi:hypothetical protein
MTADFEGVDKEIAGVALGIGDIEHNGEIGDAYPGQALAVRARLVADGGAENGFRVQGLGGHAVPHKKG